MHRQIFVSGFTRAIWIASLAFGLVLLFVIGVMAGSPTTTTAIPTRIIIPSITLDSSVAPVEQKTTVVDNKTYKTWQVADNEVGWNNLSAPLGQIGNTVLTGHSDIKAKVFQNLKDVQIGDEIFVAANVGGATQAYRYVVTHKLFVQEKGVPIAVRLNNARWINPTEDERITLITCAKPGATHRLIVVAQPVRAAQ
jgi:LPXTG-site transpeptidase (sortase) family protein